MYMLGCMEDDNESRSPELLKESIHEMMDNDMFKAKVMYEEPQSEPIFEPFTFTPCMNRQNSFNNATTNVSAVEEPCGN